MSEGSGRFRLLALWLFLTIAAVGLALILSSVALPTLNLLPIGAAVIASAALCFLVVQFWVVGTRSATPVGATAAPVRNIEYTYKDPVPIQTSAVPPTVAPGPRHHASAPKFEEDLVEFELAGPEAPIKLEVPGAFQIEVQADAEPVRVHPWIEQTVNVGGASEPSRDYVPAVERRQEIVSGLPLLSQIFSDARPTTTSTPTAQPGKTRGQCGSCGTFIWAPTQRPIRLRCPKCGHVKTLTD